VRLRALHIPDLSATLSFEPELLNNALTNARSQRAGIKKRKAFAVIQIKSAGYALNGLVWLKRPYTDLNYDAVVLGFAPEKSHMNRSLGR